MLLAGAFIQNNVWELISHIGPQVIKAINLWKWKDWKCTNGCDATNE